MFEKVIKKKKDKIYQKLTSIGPSTSIKPLNNNPRLILHLPFINNIWSLFSMFRNYILNIKTGRCIIKLLQRKFPKWRSIVGLNSILVFCNKHHSIHKSSMNNSSLSITECTMVYHFYLPASGTSGTDALTCESTQHGTKLEHWIPILIHLNEIKSKNNLFHF